VTSTWHVSMKKRLEHFKTSPKSQQNVRENWGSSAFCVLWMHCWHTVDLPFHVIQKNASVNIMRGHTPRKIRINFQLAIISHFTVPWPLTYVVKKCKLLWHYLILTFEHICVVKSHGIFKPRLVLTQIWFVQFWFNFLLLSRCSVPKFAPFSSVKSRTDLSQEPCITFSIYW